MSGPVRFAVIRFPGSNCDQDCQRAIAAIDGATADYVWHKDPSLDGFDAIVLPGGFSYGDYLRCGAIARFSPIMPAVQQAAAEGKLVIGICNGFQILCEAGLLPGALVRNAKLHFICRDASLRVETAETPFTNQCAVGDLLKIPIAHGEGRYTADAETLAALNTNQQIVLRYADANPNGSMQAIAGICNRARNVFGLMPHPDRATESRLGSDDGLKIFSSMLAASAMH